MVGVGLMKQTQKQEFFVISKELMTVKDLKKEERDSYGTDEDYEIQ